MNENIEKAVESARSISIINNTPSAIVTTVNTVPCTSWCVESSSTTWLLRAVGNDLAATARAINENLQKALETACPDCCNKYTNMATALEHHAALLRCVQTQDYAGASECALQRGVVLKRLGYKLA